MITRSSKVWVDNVEDYLFCPRKLYLTEVIGAKHPEPIRVQEGKKKHKVREKWISREGKCGVVIKNEELGLIGKVDGIVEHDDYFEVIEIKDTDREYYYGSEKLQGVLYAELVEREKDKPVKLIFRSRGSDKKMSITNEITSEALKAVEKTRKLLEGKMIPRVNHSEKCIRCPLNNVC